MNDTALQARRATVEDLPQLLELWRLEQLPAEDLDNRFTEFQVVVDKAGRVIATVGLQIIDHHGILHGEAIALPELGDEVRHLLWTRVQMVARNHSLDRIWTRLNFPAWRAIGFRPATAEERESLPAAPAAEGGTWNLLFLRDPSASADVIEKQFAMMRAMHAQESERLQQRVSVIKKIALGLTVVVTLLVITWAIMLLKYGPQFLNRGR